MIVRHVLDNPDALRHGLADAAGVASHTSGGQPMPAELRLNAIPPEVKEAMLKQLQGEPDVRQRQS